MKICSTILVGMALFALAGCSPATTANSEPSSATNDDSPPPQASSSMDAGMPDFGDAGPPPTLPQEILYEQAIAASKGRRLRPPGNVVFPPGAPRIANDEASSVALQQALKFLRDHPTVTLLRVEGHSDSQGREAQNLVVSGKRAILVKQWLVNHGIEPDRLLAVGFGGTRPIATNKTAAGRAQNRRVQFVVVARNGKVRDGVMEDGGGTVFE